MKTFAIIWTAFVAATYLLNTLATYTFNELTARWGFVGVLSGFETLVICPVFAYFWVTRKVLSPV